MGKFSKAIKKTDKVNADEPAQQKLSSRVTMQEVLTDETFDRHRIGEQKEREGSPAGRAEKKVSKIERPVGLTPSKALDSPSSEALVDSSQNIVTQVVDRPNPKDRERPPEGGNLPVSKKPVADSQSLFSTAVSTTPDAPTKSRVVQQPSELKPSFLPSDSDTEPRNRNQVGDAISAKPSRKDVRVHYSKTKVQVNDPEKLKNNRIISIIDDIETADQIKILRTQILRKLKDCGGNSILVTSANQYEGKTFTSINLGVSIAKEFDRTVLIIDADIRTPTQRHTEFATQFFSLQVDKGLSDYLLGEVEIPDILINPGINKLTLIPGGASVTNSPELLNSDRMEQMMLEIKSRYASDRIVIVDGPALLPFPDAMILSRYTDGVLPVIEAERTPVEDLKKMMNLLKETNILGTVLNKNKG